jgi:hypothetical protein
MSPDWLTREHEALAKRLAEFYGQRSENDWIAELRWMNVSMRDTLAEKLRRGEACKARELLSQLDEERQE